MSHGAVLLVCLAAACRGTETIAPTLGALRVETSMAGTDIDRDGVLVALDDTTQVVVASNGAYLFTDLVAGSHVVTLSGLVPNCVPSGPATKTVTTHADTTLVTFTAACTQASLAATGLIAFSRANPDHTWDLWVMNHDGTAVTPLHDSPGVSDFQPAWTPDGQSILFVSGSQIFRIGRTGGAVTHVADNAYSPSVSPDGQHIVYTKDVGGNYDIWVMNSDGTNQQPLTTDAAYEDHPSWSPDGSQIVFERGYRLYVMNNSGANAHNISAADAIEDRWPSWSPDGTKILFIRRGFGQDHVHTIKPDGTGLTPLTSGLDNDDFPAWTADGSRIVFSSGRGGYLAIWSMRADGTDLRRLSVGPPTPYDSYPACSR